MTPILVILIALASVVFYVGAYHLLFYIRTRERREILSFAVLCFTVSLYDLLCAGLYNAVDPTEGIYWQQKQAIVMAIFAICLTGFVSDFIQQTRKRLTYILYGYWLTQLLLLIFAPTEMIWTRVHAIKVVEILGTTVIYNEVLPSTLINIQSVMGGITSLYVLTLLVQRCRSGFYRETLPVLAGVLAVALAVMRDTAVMAGCITSFYTIEFAFMILVFAMAYSLATFHAEIRSALRLSRNELKQLAAAIDAVDESIFITDTNGIICYVNPAFERTTGYSRSDSLGQKVSILRSGRHKVEFYEEVWNTIRSGRTWHGTFYNRRKEGTIIEQESTISPVRDATGTIVNYVAVERDVTQQRMMEGRVRQSQKMAAVGQLAHRIAHDCTNVLVRVMGNAELARTHVLPGTDAVRHLDEIVAAAHSMATLTSSLLSFSHPGSPAFKPTRLRNVLTSMFWMIKSTMSPNVDVVLEEDLVNPKVMIDQGQIEQAIMHIILNSADAMPETGRLVLEIAEVAPDQPLWTTLNSISDGKATVGDRRYAALSIQDNGPGMDSDTLAQVFEPFFTTKTDKKNAGLGLCTVYSIIESHHGYIVCDSAPACGTRVTLFLPLAP